MNSCLAYSQSLCYANQLLAVAAYLTESRVDLLAITNLQNAKVVL